jgi:Domain of unknown function (DUF4262)
MGHPELVLLGASTDTACGVLNEVGRRVRACENLTVGALLTFDEWPHRITVEEVPNPGAILFGANRHYQRPAAASVPALQLTHDDVHGRFPWDDDYCIPTWISLGLARTPPEVRPADPLERAPCARLHACTVATARGLKP